MVFVKFPETHFLDRPGQIEYNENMTALAGKK